MPTTPKAYAIVHANRRMRTEKGTRKRWYWSTYDVRVSEFLLAQAGIVAGDRVMVTAIERGMLVISRLE